MTAIDEAPADIREMYVVHIALRREYDLLWGLVLGVAHGDQEGAGVVADHIRLLNSVLHRHHQGEDRHLWPRILARGAADVTPLVQTVERQHAGVDRAMAEVELALAGWCQNPDSGQAVTLARAIDILGDRLEEHLETEEQQLLPLIEKHITASEWARMGEDGGADTPPEEAALIFGMMMYEGDSAVLQDMLSHLPADVAEVLGELAPKAYAEYCRRIHGTPTPRRITEV